MSNKQSTAMTKTEAAEHTLANLETQRRTLIQRGQEIAEERKRISFSALAENDAKAKVKLENLGAESITHAAAMESVLAAIAEAQQRLQQAQQAVAREQRRSELKEQQQHSKEFRELGPFMDKATDNLRRGLLALAKNAASVGKDHRHVATLHRCLMVAFFGTPLQEYVGVPDSNDRRSFASFSGVVNAWCDSQDAALRHELAALDGAQTNEKAA